MPVLAQLLRTAAPCVAPAVWLCGIFVASGAIVNAQAALAATAVTAALRPAHHTDGGFRNPWGLPRHDDAPLGVTLPFFVRRVASSLGGNHGRPPRRVEPDLALIQEVNAARGNSVTWVGHSTFLFQMAGVRFLTDPTWSNTASPVSFGPRRYVDPGLEIDDLGRIDFVVISHNHYDHLDVDTLKRLSNGHTRFLVPLANRETLERHRIGPVVELDWWDSITIGEARIHCVPARHWSRRAVTDMDRALWSGWVVRTQTQAVYFAGDTGMFPGFEEIARRLGPIDLAAIPIGAYEPRAMMEPSHLTPEEAIDAVIALQALNSVAMHFGTFDLTDELIHEPPDRFTAASTAAGRGPDRDWVFAVGETRVF